MSLPLPSCTCQLIQHPGISDPCSSFEPAYKRFLFPTNNSTVQFFAEEIGKLFTWSQVLVENPVDPPINVTDWLENPSLEQVLTVIPGQGTFEGLMRFGNEESGLCAQFVSSEPFIPDSGYDSLERCDESDARQVSPGSLDFWVTRALWC